MLFAIIYFAEKYLKRHVEEFFHFINIPVKGFLISSLGIFQRFSGKKGFGAPVSCSHASDRISLTKRIWAISWNRYK